MTTKHFGVVVRQGPKYGHNISRQTYGTINKRNSHYFPKEADPDLWDKQASYFEDESHLYYSDDWCTKHQKDVLENFDINMDRFAELDEIEFESHLTSVISKYPKMVEVTDLNEWDGVSAIYVMVLDRFLQVYVGIAESSRGLKGRIRDHWSTNKQFDRLLFGSVEQSKLSIDSFRALDTTRIFALETNKAEKFENSVLELFPSKFVLNRVAGGRPNNETDLLRLARQRLIHQILED